MGREKDSLFDEWTLSVPKRLLSDPLWESLYYQKAMYLYDLAWMDCEILRKDFRGRSIVHQLIRSAGSVCANMEEAYGRGVGSADYVRILRIALGEARETQGWYLRSRKLLPVDVLEQRLDVISHLIAMLVRQISKHRKKLS